MTATATALPASAAAPDPPSHRRCIATGALHGRDWLLRFVVAPGGEVVPDIAARLPGRGLWLTPRRDIVEQAVVKRLFARSARRPVAVLPDLADRVEALLARRCCDGLGLARRAGLAVAGFERVAEAVRRSKAGLLLGALDGAEGGRFRLAALGRDLPLAAVLTAAELGAVFGRERVVHAAVGPGPLSRRVLADLRRLAGFRAGAAVDGEANFAPAERQQDGNGTNG